MKLVRGRTLAALLETRRGPDAGPDALPLHLRAGLPDNGLRPRSGCNPPGPEAVKHHGRQLRRGAGHGLGPGQGARSGGLADEKHATSPSDDAGRRLHVAERVGDDGVAPRLGARNAVVHGPEQAQARWTRSTSGRMFSPWARCSARSSPESRRSWGKTVLTFTARRSGPTSRTRSRDSTHAMPTRSWWPCAVVPGRRAKHRPRDAGTVVARLTDYLRGVEGRLREAELAQARA